MTEQKLNTEITDEPDNIELLTQVVADDRQQAMSLVTDSQRGIDGSLNAQHSCQPARQGAQRSGQRISDRSGGRIVQDCLSLSDDAVFLPLPEN